MALIDNIKAYWKLNETGGSRADSVGSLSLTDNNTVLYGTGKVGNAADFEADSSEYLTRADNVALRIDDGWSVSCWFKLESIHPSGTGWSRVLFYQRSGENGVAMGVYNDGGVGKFAVMTGAGNFGHHLGPGVTISLNTWYHVVVCFNGSSTKVYLNNTAYTFTDCTAITPPNATFNMGKDHLTTQHWDGLIDEFGIWQKTLSASEVLELYNGGSGLTHPFTSVTPKNPALLLSLI